MSNPIQDALAFINANPEEQKKKLFKQDILDIDEFLSSPYQSPSPVKTLTEEQEFSVDKYEVDPERERQFLEASAQLSGQPLPAASKKYTLDDILFLLKNIASIDIKSKYMSKKSNPWVSFNSLFYNLMSKHVG